VVAGGAALAGAALEVAQRAEGRRQLDLAAAGGRKLVKYLTVKYLTAV
jgi:hypothetical protein